MFACLFVCFSGILWPNKRCHRQQKIHFMHVRKKWTENYNRSSWPLHQLITVLRVQAHKKMKQSLLHLKHDEVLFLFVIWYLSKDRRGLEGWQSVLPGPWTVKNSSNLSRDRHRQTENVNYRDSNPTKRHQSISFVCVDTCVRACVRACVCVCVARHIVWKSLSQKLKREANTDNVR